MQLRFEQTIPLPRPVLFAFHEDAAHLVLLHRGWARFRLLHHEGGLQVGSRIWFETTLAGIVPVVLGFEHTVYEPPARFAECLIHGPFRRFTHSHEFQETAAGTVLCDVLDVELAWYYGGELMMSVVVAPLLRRAFRLRGKALLSLVQTGQIADRTGRAIL